ncbi:MAG: prepilin-type N-terminal cleavage/methylation domain-containing protein [Cytophagales bacterium]|nr:prepilin-type N-terminal cleavage/methylation domain-containing protein [Cytophagales bacterium]
MKKILQKLNAKAHAIRKAKMRGFTLVELMVVLGIAAAVAAFIIPDMLEARMQTKVKKDIDDISAIQRNSIRIYGGDPDFSNMTNVATASAAGVIPKAADGSGTVRLTNSYGVPWTLAPTNLLGTNDGAALVAGGYDADSCRELVNQIATIVRTLSIGTTVVKPIATGTYNRPAAMTACAAVSGTTTITMAWTK